MTDESTDSLPSDMPEALQLGGRVASGTAGRLRAALPPVKKLKDDSGGRLVGDGRELCGEAIVARAARPGASSCREDRPTDVSRGPRGDLSSDQASGRRTRLMLRERCRRRRVWKLVRKTGGRQERMTVQGRRKGRGPAEGGREVLRPVRDGRSVVPLLRAHRYRRLAFPLDKAGRVRPPPPRASHAWPLSNKVGVGGVRGSKGRPFPARR